MFLDEELLQMCVDADCDTTDQLQQLNRDLCEKCEAYYKSKILPTSSYRDVKVVLDKTFNLFDSFVRLAEKHKDAKVRILADLFSNHTFKSQLLSNEKMKEFYNKL